MESNSDKNQIHVVEDGTDVITFIHDVTKSGQQKDAFYVFDANDLIQKYEIWKQKLPRVSPYYAMKCNHHLNVLKVLASLGLGFDCASKGEISKILSLGVEPSRIIFANPTKPAPHIRYASDHNVDIFTFDNDLELHKFKALNPTAKLLLRIRCDASIARGPLGVKYGCDAANDAPRILRVARDLELDVVGVCFHVGSYCGEPAAYRRAISKSWRVFQLGKDLGFNMSILDIGGGFPGDNWSTFNTIADTINAALDEYFPAGGNIDIMAEPGRYFVASAFTLAAMIHSKREITDPDSGEVTSNMYFINDGVFGSLGVIARYKVIYTPVPLLNDNNKKTLPSSVWGPTCHSIDLIVQNVNLPELDIDDWVVFKNKGAYTLAMATSFNGFPIANVYTIINKTTLPSIKELFERYDEKIIFNHNLRLVDGS